MNANNWQPIDTAPRTGERVLLYRPHMSAVIGHWDDQKHHTKRRPYWASDEHCRSTMSDRNNPPSHWQPLPLPPE